jgi:hypothetical protein
MNLRYGMKEVANVIFFDVATGKPVIFFDTLKVSTIENESESAEARGGQGNGKLMSWDYGRSATLNLQDALLSDNSLALLSGSAVKSTNVDVVGRETLAIVDNAGSKEVTLAEAPKEGTVVVYAIENGLITKEITATNTGNVVKLTGTNPAPQAGQSVMVFYTYTATSGANKVTFSANAFPATYKVVGDTVVRGEDGLDRKMQFVIPRAKLQTTFSLTMDAENVSTFDFNLDAMVSRSSNGEPVLYEVIRIDNK